MIANIFFLLTFILIIIFLSNFVLYWIIFLKTENKKSKGWKIYTKIYIGIWSSTLVAIPIITSSFITSFTYFGLPYWIFFLLIGIVFVGIAIKLAKDALEMNKCRGLEKGRYPLITEGPYQIMRHPMYASWVFTFLGLAFILDSIIALIITPFLLLLLELEGILEEKYLLIPKFGKNYKKFKKNTPYRIIPPPYNALLIIIALFVVYVGLINFGVLESLQT